MLTVRRIYLYLVAAISLVAITWAVIGLARLILSEGIGRGQITELAWLLAVIIVGLPIFLFHWLMAQRLANSSEAEYEAPVRQLYFYGLMAAAALPILSNIYRLVDNGLVALLGGVRPGYYPYDLTAAEHVAAILIWTVVWVYHWRLARPLSDRHSASVLYINLGIRRFYLFAFALGGLVMVTWGAIGLLQTLMQLSGLVVGRTAMANFSAQLLVGTAIWAGHWTVLQHDFAGGDRAEERSVLRKVYLYLAVFVYSVMALVSGTLLLKRLIELALGAPPSPEPLLSQLSLPVPFLIVGVLLWVYHWRVLRHDAGRAPEAPRQAGVRRIYAYLVAAVGLVALLTGLVGLLVQLIDLLTSPATVGLSYYREEVALFVAMVVVATPVWLVPWRAMQRLATTPASITEGSADERRSTVRKVYLYAFVFIASLAIFGSVGWFVFQILTLVLGADLPDDFLTQVLNALVISLLAVGVWLYHWWAIRHDGQLEQQEQRQRLAQITVVVIDGDQGELGQSLIREMKAELPGIQLKPVGVTSQATEAMAGQTYAASLLDQANYLVGSWQSLTGTEVAPAAASSPALKFVVPLADQGWIWTGIKARSTEYYARQAVQGIKQAIDGEEISFGLDWDIGTIVAIVGGILFFLIVAGSLLVALLAAFG
jgi:hypothetical protein